MVLVASGKAPAPLRGAGPGAADGRGEVPGGGALPLAPSSPAQWPRCCCNPFICQVPLPLRPVPQDRACREASLMSDGRVD